MIRGAAHKVAHLYIDGVQYAEAPLQPSGISLCAGCAGHKDNALCDKLPDSCVDLPIIFVKAKEQSQ